MDEESEIDPLLPTDDELRNASIPLIQFLLPSEASKEIQPNLHNNEDFNNLCKEFNNILNEESMNEEAHDSTIDSDKVASEDDTGSEQENDFTTEFPNVKREQNDQSGFPPKRNWKDLYRKLDSALEEIFMEVALVVKRGSIERQDEKLEESSAEVTSTSNHLVDVKNSTSDTETDTKKRNSNATKRLQDDKTSVTSFKRSRIHERYYSGSRAFPCREPKCSYAANYKCNLQVHERAMHGKETNSSEVTPTLATKAVKVSDKRLYKDDKMLTKAVKVSDKRLSKDDKMLTKAVKVNDKRLSKDDKMLTRFQGNPEKHQNLSGHSHHGYKCSGCESTPLVRRRKKSDNGELAAAKDLKTSVSSYLASSSSSSSSSSFSSSVSSLSSSSETRLNNNNEEQKLVNNEQDGAALIQKALEEDKQTVYSCSKCIFITTVERGLKRHITVAHANESTKGKGTALGGTSQSKVRRESVDDNVDKKIYRCSQCSFVSRYQGIVKTHQRKGHLSSQSKLKQNAKLYSCAECDYSSDFKNCLQSHEWSHLNLRKKICASNGGKNKRTPSCQIYNCGTCAYSSKFRFNVKKHELTHLKNPEDIIVMKIFKCVECQYMSKLRSQVEEHRLKHTDIAHCRIVASKAFKCSKCHFTSNSRSYVSKHLTSHLPYGKQMASRVYKCTYCLFTSAFPTVVKTHETTHSNFDLVESSLKQEKKDLECDRCDYRSKSNSDLLKHKLLHEEKRFKCSQCSYATNINWNLQQHKLTHLTTKKHKCTNCNFSTNYKTYFNRHLSEKQCM